MEFFRNPRQTVPDSPPGSWDCWEVSYYVLLKHLLFQGGVRKLIPLDVLVVTSEEKYFSVGRGC